MEIGKYVVIERISDKKKYRYPNNLVVDLPTGYSVVKYSCDAGDKKYKRIFPNNNSAIIRLYIEKCVKYNRLIEKGFFGEGEITDKIIIGEISNELKLEYNYINTFLYQNRKITLHDFNVEILIKSKLLTENKIKSLLKKNEFKHVRLLDCLHPEFAPKGQVGYLLNNIGVKGKYGIKVFFSSSIPFKEGLEIPPGIRYEIIYSN
ncbi:MAG: hypothetical protein PVH88_02080 [Ignavibacteria bacterium]|jgi:hypothetical protein